MKKKLTIKKNKASSSKERSSGNENSDNRILSIYLREINLVPLLTRKEEIHYATLAQKGDNSAKEYLVRANLRFVVIVAKKYQNQGLPLVDLISEGKIGIINAVERFDVTKGYHFISYAVWWIRQSILKAICEKSRMIRLPLNRANELVQVEKARKELQGHQSSEPTTKDLSAEVGLSESNIEQLLSVSRGVVSLDTPAFTDETASIGDFVADEESKNPEELADDQELKEQINRVLKTLTNKESDIIQRRFGLNGKRALSLKEIGNRYHLTKERIRQIEKKALIRLRHPSRSQYLEAFAASA